MKKLITATLVLCALCILATPAFGFELSVPNEVPNYRDLEVFLDLGPGDTVRQARFYFMAEKGTKLLFSDFVLRDNEWRTTIPFRYLVGEELEYYVQIQTAAGTILRMPEAGKSKARLIMDTTPPTLLMIKPKEFFLDKGKENEIRFKVSDDSIIAAFEVRYDGTLVKDSLFFQETLYFLVTPPADDKKEVKIEITVVDYFNNRIRKEFTYLLERQRGTFFSIRNDYVAKMKVRYDLAFGESRNTTDIITHFQDLTQDAVLEYEIGGRTRPNAGPLSLDLSVTLADNISMFELAQAYPNSLIADYQNFAKLLHPWDFANEFDWTGQVRREYYNLNKAYAKVALFDPILAYTFGDQKLTYQKETLNEFEFRGHSLSFKVPLITIAAAKGLSDPGLYQTTWPQNFAGVEAGIDINQLFYLKTNLSLISALQGRYDNLVLDGARSQIGTLYDLGSIKPDQNLVLGLTTGSTNKLFTLSVGGGLTLYNEDASEFLDLDSLASQLRSFYDITPYLSYVNQVKAIFPIFDYFPVTKGLAAKALNRNLWGMTYGADLKILPIGLKAWFHKTDSAYKSLGASSVDTDQMKAGGEWTKNLGDFDLSVAYEWKKDNIPDILFTEILPIFITGFGATAVPSVDDISNLVHVATAAVQTPSFGAFGSVKLSYAFGHDSTNAAELAAGTTNAAARTALLGSTLKDTLITHTGGLQWRSGRFKLGSSILTLGANTEDSYLSYTEVDGAASSLTAWEFAYGLDGALEFGRSKVSLGFKHDWTTTATPETNFEYSAKYLITKGFLDKIQVGGLFTQELLSGALQNYTAGGQIILEKAFGKLVTSIGLETTFLDSMVLQTDDKITSKVNIAGVLEL